jgi:hypothetical protein
MSAWASGRKVAVDGVDTSLRMARAMGMAVLIARFDWP